MVCVCEFWILDFYGVGRFLACSDSSGPTSLGLSTLDPKDYGCSSHPLWGTDGIWYILWSEVTLNIIQVLRVLTSIVKYFNMTYIYLTLPKLCLSVHPFPSNLCVFVRDDHYIVHTYFVFQAETSRSRGRVTNL
jgi:hypothetical protein